MPAMGTDLLVLEAPSITAGFRFLNSLANVKLVDAEPIGGAKFLILAQGPAATLKAAAASAKGSDFEIIEAVSQDVLDAVYSLAPNKLDESLLILESTSATALIAIAQILVKHHELRAVEIKIRKTGAGGGYAYFTGAREKCETAAIAGRAWLTTKMRDGSIEVLDQPTDLTRSLFES